MAKNKDLEEIRKRVEIINGEVREVIGELRTVKWLLAAVLPAVYLALLRLFLPSG